MNGWKAEYPMDRTVAATISSDVCLERIIFCILQYYLLHAIGLLQAGANSNALTNESFQHSLDFSGVEP
jgi:hypothetical protein